MEETLNDGDRGMHFCSASLRLTRAVLACGLLVNTVLQAASERQKPHDPAAVLRKPIPNKLVVLTFDDGCASGCTVIAPTLKRLGFGGSFYICDFDSFGTRKDWYLTWRQMKAMAAAGFEIGNHTKGHAGGSGIRPYLAMEQDLLDNDVPKPTTIAWPMYQVNTKTFPDLTTNGYVFGRGGHQRPYRPTGDHPLDVPSFGVGSRATVATFVSYVRQAVEGRIVVLTFHGVPDMEHPPCSVAPATFKLMMKYLKDNEYKVIALRDLAEYIDPAKALELPPTERNVKLPPLVRLADEIKPWVAKDIVAFRIPGLPPAHLSCGAISMKAPYAADLTALVPEITVSPGAAVAPASGAPRDFTTPLAYTVTGSDGSRKVYTVTVDRAAASAAKRIVEFAVPEATSVTISDGAIDVYVLPGTDVTKLAPTATLSPLSTAVPPSGTRRDFSQSQLYTLTAQDGSSRVYTVRVTETSRPNVFTWARPEPGNWRDAKRWTDNLGKGSAPPEAGWMNCVLHFDQPGKYAVVNDLEGFILNQLNARGPSINVDGRDLVFSASEFGTLPRLFQTKRGDITVTAPITLTSDLIVDAEAKGMVRITGLVAGPGRLIKNGEGQLWIGNRKNTYDGGTLINSGRLTVMTANEGLGTGPVTLNGDATLHLERVDGTNPLVLNGGIIDAGNGFGCTWNAPIVLNGNTKISSYAAFKINDQRGGMTGSGGFTQVGFPRGFRRKGGTISLWGANSYTGPTTVTQEADLWIRKASALYGADPAQWTPAKITVANAATLRLSVGGPGEFDGHQVVRLLTQLTRSVENNGLMKGAIVALDTTNAPGPVTLAGDLSNSQGPGGGIIVIEKCGKGTLIFTGTNHYTGTTRVTKGVLSIPHATALAPETDVHILRGAVLDLNFTGSVRIRELRVDGKLQPAGSYRTGGAAHFIRGTGALTSTWTELHPPW